MRQRGRKRRRVTHFFSGCVPRGRKAEAVLIARLPRTTAAAETKLRVAFRTRIRIIWRYLWAIYIPPCPGDMSRAEWRRSVDFFSFSTFFPASSSASTRLSNEVPTTSNTSAPIIVYTMRRHSLDPDRIRQQIKSIFTSPTRKFRNFTHQHGPTASAGRTSRRFSVPDHNHRVAGDLGTIDEVNARTVRVHVCSACPARNGV